MFTLNDALFKLFSDIQRTDIQTVAIEHADNRILATDLYAPISLPPQDNSAMDGYCLHLDFEQPIPDKFPIVDYILAGSTGKDLALNCSARIFTGATVPKGANVVIMQEKCKVENGYLTLENPADIKLGQNIRKAGEDIETGTIAIKKGTLLTPRHLALAVALSRSHLTIHKPLKVAVISTGNELCNPDNNKIFSKIYDSNRPMLCGYLKRFGCEVTDAGLLPDHYDTIKKKFDQLAESHDLILSSGGVSVGEADYVKAVVEEIGELKLWKLAIKPGKPLAYGKIRNADFIGLPGNPVSSLVTLLMVARPYILKRQGIQHVDVKPMYVPVNFNYTKPDMKRSEFIRVYMNEHHQLELSGTQGSAMMFPMTLADGLVQLQPAQTVQKGDILPYFAFSLFE